MSHGNGDARMVKLAELWERVSAKGTRYFSGFLGDAQILMFDAGEREHPTKPGETVHVWRLMVQERDPARRPEAEQEGELRPRPEPTSRSSGTAAPNAPDKPSARPVERGSGWRGPSAYRRGNGARRAPAADGGALVEDGLEDLYR